MRAVSVNVNVDTVGDARMLRPHVGQRLRTGLNLQSVGASDLAAERFDGAGSSLGNGRIGIRGLLGGFQSIGIFFCGLGGFLLSNYSLIQGLLSFIRCSSVFPKGRRQMLIALT